ncbi:Protein CBG27552 [Caenorhabditis briggsae]|uniref:Protein CBG27552 n=1 Tax=Caenorhabditis briggsae TaxID=6238 RepID=B6IKL6_CAEBR|nr:Protein CBG27552 [Caenorhabditis briggsae]CAS00446.1 Protein CBG27552 [Caenorhabditis briggsae]
MSISLPVGGGAFTPSSLFYRFMLSLGRIVMIYDCILSTNLTENR